MMRWFHDSCPTTPDEAHFDLARRSGNCSTTRNEHIHYTNYNHN